MTHRTRANSLIVSDESRAVEVVKVLSDDYSRKIILSIITNSLPIEEISREQNIPISTCYRRLHEMLNYGIIKPDRTIIREDGKKYVCYKSAIKTATINLDSGELKVDVVVNKDPSEKLGTLWSDVRNSVSSSKSLPGETPKIGATTTTAVQKIAPSLKV